jgi:Holliday junction resolvase-like predicted endonuclease
MNSKVHAGAIAELFACQYFSTVGLEVFRNVAASGPVDIVLYNKDNGILLPIDIKSTNTPYTRADGSLMLNIKIGKREDGVWNIGYVHGEDSLRLPEGFWEALGCEDT